jgi:2-amino-4-hydroxy-6-hydroxymethyldihydropteridine diphosphokinase
MKEAIARISAFAPPVLARSRVYVTAPVGGPPQPDYLNAAILIEWDRSAIALLDHLQAIELALGRVRGERNGPRTIDLDILWSDGPPIDEERLTVPHPRLKERAFALRPLLDVVPAAYVLPHEMVVDSSVEISPLTLA